MTTGRLSVAVIVLIPSDHTYVDARNTLHDIVVLSLVLHCCSPPPPSIPFL